MRALILYLNSILDVLDNLVTRPYPWAIINMDSSDEDAVAAHPQNRMQASIVAAQGAR